MAARNVGVLLPAAGSGSRMGGERKQNRLLGDAPVLVQAARALARHPEVLCTVIAAPPGEGGAVIETLARYDVDALVVEGGATRQQSVARGLDALPPEVEIVLVHDAVRPFVGQPLVGRVVDAVRTYGAAVPAIAVTDTLRQAASAFFGETVPRDGLYRVQTPQGFRRDWLEQAHAHAEREAAATDDAHLVQALGHPVRLVEGDARNVKLTTPDDWALARALWPLFSAS